MNKNSIILIVATFLVLSSLAVSMEYTANGNANLSTFSPNIPLGVTETGNVTIYADGTVSNTSVIQQVGTSNTYDLLTNVLGSLSIYRNSTVLNGNGLTITGGSSSSDHGAIVSSNTTGITIENVVIGSSSYYGVNFYSVNNVLVDKVKSIDFTGNILISMLYSSNITVENGNYSFSSSNYGINAQYGSSITVYNNTFSGSNGYSFVSTNGFSYTYVEGNTIMSTNMGTGISVTYGSFASFTGNIINYTSTGIYFVNSVNGVSEHNLISNSTSAAITATQDNSFSSTYDTITNGQAPYNIDMVSSNYLNHDNASNFGSYSTMYYFTTLTISNSNLSSSASVTSLDIEQGVTVNMFNDTVLSNPTLTSSDAIYFDYISGLLNLSGDSITAFSGAGIYADYSPQIEITNSHFNATQSIYYRDSSIDFAKITNNYFELQNRGDGFDFNLGSSSYPNLFNVNFSNNTLISPSSTWGNYGLYFEPGEILSNISVFNNSFLNISNPIDISPGSFGNDVFVQNNNITNSSNAISVSYVMNTIVTSNNIINTSGVAVGIYGTDFGAITSNNNIENMPGFASMLQAIYYENIIGGTNVIFNNTIVNPGIGSSGIYISSSAGTSAYSNTVDKASNALYVSGSLNVSVFGNTVNDAFSYGIRSYQNTNTSYYSNEIDNASTSLSSIQDHLTTVFSNTFYDAQSSNPSLQFLNLQNYGGLTFYHNNFINNTINSNVSNLFTGANGPLYMNEPLPVGGNYYSNYTGSGSNGIGNIPMVLSGSIRDLYPLTYEWNSPTVTFVETGLSSGTSWSVTLGNTMKAGTSSNMVFQQTNGLYSTESYSVTNVPGYTASVTSGTVHLDGSSNVVTINFNPITTTQATYNVTFSESGLASGTSWSVTFNGAQKTTTGTSILFNIANGTYSYSIGSASGYTVATSSGTVTVSGSAVSVSVQYANNTTQSGYILTVNETGLPAGDTWALTVGNHTYNTTLASFTVNLVPGTYNVTISGPTDYTVVLSSSNVTIASGNRVINATFTQNKVTPSSSSTIYYGLIIGLIVGGGSAAMGTMYYTETGVFRKK